MHPCERYRRQGGRAAKGKAVRACRRPPQRKVGLIACSGEDLPEGTVSRRAALLVLERLRPSATVTLCLPLFLAGEERERAFARFYPTIAIDGCEKRCAARATEMYSARPAASLVVSDLADSLGLARPRRLRGSRCGRRGPGPRRSR